METQLIETWEIHNRINLYMLAAVDERAWTATAASGGRTVGDQFGHMHNVRLLWLAQGTPLLSTALEKIEKGCVDGARLRDALEHSGSAIAQLLQGAFETNGPVKGFRPHAVAFFGYLISHESHHRGQIALTLKQAGFPLEKKVAYGLWEWGVR